MKSIGSKKQLSEVETSQGDHDGADDDARPTVRLIDEDREYLDDADNSDAEEGEWAEKGAESVEDGGGTLEWESDDDDASSDEESEPDREGMVLIFLINYIIRTNCFDCSVDNYFLPLDNPLVVQLEDEAKRRSRKTSSWFSNPLFKGVEKDQDEEEEMQKTIKKVKLKGREIVGEK